MFGRGRFNVGVLVNPILELRFNPADTERLAAFRDLIWSEIIIGFNAPSRRDRADMFIGLR